MTSFEESLDLSHDEDSGSYDHREKKHRTIFSAEQKAALEKMFAENPFPDKKQREELALRIGVNNPKSVDYWFGHRRAKNRHRSHAGAETHAFHTVPGSHSSQLSDDGGDYDDQEDDEEVPDYYERSRPRSSAYHHHGHHLHHGHGHHASAHHPHSGHRSHHAHHSSHDEEDEFNSIMFGNQSAYERQQQVASFRKPAAPVLISRPTPTPDRKRSASDAFQRPENAGLEQLWVACLLNQFYLEPRAASKPGLVDSESVSAMSVSPTPSSS